MCDAGKSDSINLIEYSFTLTAGQSLFVKFCDNKIFKQSTQRIMC